MSLKKIAEITGTSISTVSRVLNSPNHSCHDPLLSDKIWETAKELNYLPNEAARSLRKNNDNMHTDVLTVDIFLTRFDSIGKDPFFSELFQSIKEDLFRQNCLIGDVFYTTECFLDTIQRKENCGLIILGKCPQELIVRFKKRYEFLVGIDRNPTDYQYDEVVCNGTIAASIAMEHLISLGHKNIAYIGDCTYESRYVGYYQAHLEHRLPLKHANIYPTSQTEEEGYHIMCEILQAQTRPTAIFCANDVTALGVLRALKKNKSKGYLPSVISIDDISESQYTNPPLTTVRIPIRDMGHLAIMILLDRFHGYHTQPVRLELPCSLIIRESCYPANN